MKRLVSSVADCMECAWKTAAHQWVIAVRYRINCVQDKNWIKDSFLSVYPSAGSVPYAPIHCIRSHIRNRSNSSGFASRLSGQRSYHIPISKYLRSLSDSDNGFSSVYFLKCPIYSWSASFWLRRIHFPYLCTILLPSTAFYKIWWDKKSASDVVFLKVPQKKERMFFHKHIWYSSIKKN